MINSVPNIIRILTKASEICTAVRECKKLLTRHPYKSLSGCAEYRHQHVAIVTSGGVQMNRDVRFDRMKYKSNLRSLVVNLVVYHVHSVWHDI